MITLEQLIEIAKVGFPQRVLDQINFDNCETMFHGDLYRLYDKDVEFIVLLPKETILSVEYPNEDYIQISVGNKAFNHLAGIKKMKELGLIKKPLE